MEQQNQITAPTSQPLEASFIQPIATQVSYEPALEVETFETKANNQIAYPPTTAQYIEDEVDTPSKSFSDIGRTYSASDDGSSLMSNALIALASGDKPKAVQFADLASKAFEKEGSLSSAIVALTFTENPEHFAA
mgnify:FL=1